MDKIYNHKDHEKEIYSLWEKGGYFTPKIDPSKKPYTIVLPPPNGSGKMHTGNVLMIAIEDILIRWHRMMGDSTLWIPGTDHAGTETQITFERELAKQDKSRFNYSREELYKQIWEFVQNNKHNIENQIREMGASVDWSRYKFTLDPDVVSTVHQTFKKMVADDLVYRGEYMVNYCPKCGTTYSDVELSHKERKDPLFYIKYKLSDSEEFITVATVRPEPIWADTHLAINPKDEKNKYLAGKKVLNPLTGAEMEIITDEFVDPDFGTGIVKLTPAVDKNDYDVALKHNLPINQVLDWDGKLVGPYQGQSVFTARKNVVDELEPKGLIEKIDKEYLHTVTLCKAGHDIEPMVIPNWFIKVDAPHKSFKKPAYEAVKEGKVKIFPKWREKTYLRWMEEMHDWPVSRQNVWGIQIPVWYQIDNDRQFYVWFTDKEGNYKHGTLGQFLDTGVSLDEIKNGLQRVHALKDTAWVLEEDKKEGVDYLPETDTFDTWFSSGQWPLATLGYPDSEDFKYFYPTSVLETGWEIIRLWVSRMIMFGIYLTGEPPFKDVYLHGMVRALDGRKMSKSLGNVINPDDYLEEFGADALRMGLITGTANGKDFSFPRDKVIGFQKFGNKIWNMARFLQMLTSDNKELLSIEQVEAENLSEEDKELLNNLNTIIEAIQTKLEKFRFAEAGEIIYHYLWHDLADIQIERVKKLEDKKVSLSILIHAYLTGLKLLHPFMPFITETIWQELKKDELFNNTFQTEEALIVAPWPTNI